MMKSEIKSIKEGKLRAAASGVVVSSGGLVALVEASVHIGFLRKFSGPKHVAKAIA
jgi:ethanolamine utilization microcompartment shell protein EutS